MKRFILLPLILVFVSAFAQTNSYIVDALVDVKSNKRTISVGGLEADISGFTNTHIQFAIDALGQSGGTVKLTKGTFTIEAPVRLYSNINLIGSGPETVLKKTKGVQSRYIVDADYGELKLTVEDPAGFEIGMKIQVKDDENSGCWNVSTGYITDIQDNIIYIDTHLMRDYRSDLNGFVSNASSVIDVIEAENVVISNFTADGNRENTFRTDGCNGAGVLMFKSKHITVDNVHVKDFNGEGISWQITENITVKNCEISGSGNIGLHPGTGSPLSIIENNNLHHNDMDGLFICWRVHHSLVKGNKFHHNGRYGICTGHKDTDVLFENNHIFENGSDGVNLRGEREANAPHRNTFSNNIIENNGIKGSGYGFSVNSPVKDVVLKNNIIRDNLKGTQVAGVFIFENGSAVKLENNKINGHSMGDLVYEKDIKK